MKVPLSMRGIGRRRYIGNKVARYRAIQREEKENRARQTWLRLASSSSLASKNSAIPGMKKSTARLTWLFSRFEKQREWRKLDRSERANEHIR